MELTNYSFLQSRNDYMTAVANRKVAADRVATGKRMQRSGTDVGSISQLSYQRTEMLSDRQSIINLQNLRSRLFAQENALNRVHEMYERMEILAIKAANPITTKQERLDYGIEFEAYQEQLQEIMLSKYNGTRLFSSTLMCGDPEDVPLGELDLATIRQTWNHAVRHQEVETGSPSGTISFRVNSGNDGDIYRVWMGNTCIFSMGGMPDPASVRNQNYDDYKGTGTDYGNPDPNWNISGSRWKTSESAKKGDDDRVEVTFGPGKETTYKIYLGLDNRDANGDSLWHNDAANVSVGDTTTGYVPGEANWSYDDDEGYVYKGSGSVPGYYTNIPSVINTQDLIEESDSTNLTLQIETKSIGIIYKKDAAAAAMDEDDETGDADGSGLEGVVFTPSTFIRKIPKDRHGNNILLDPKGFDTFNRVDSDGVKLDNLNSTTSAQKAVNKMRGNGGYFGEMKCIVENRLGILGSEYKRVDEEIRVLEEQIISGEVTQSRIRDADMAKEATELAKESMKSAFASQVMNESSRIKDVLIPLTSNHFRGSIMSAGF